MVTQELLNYIQSELQLGKKADDITASLITPGWLGQDIESAFNQLGYNTTSLKPSLIQRFFINKKFLVIGVATIILLSLVAGVFAYNGFLKKTNKKITSTVSITPFPSASSTKNCGIENVDMSPLQKAWPDHPRLKCFIDATKTCSAAKIVVNGRINLAGMTTSTAYYDIKKDISGGCSLHLKQGTTNHIFPTEVSQTDRQVVLDALKKTDNTEGICLFKKNADLSEVFNKTYKGEFSFSTDPKDSPYAKGQCSGSYFDLMYKPIQPTSDFPVTDLQVTSIQKGSDSFFPWKIIVKNNNITMTAGSFNLHLVSLDGKLTSDITSGGISPNQSGEVPITSDIVKGMATFSATVTSAQKAQ